jgi:soluble lytic murein transglycosylase-like protein
MNGSGAVRLERRVRERRRLLAVGSASFALLLLAPRPASDGPRELAPAETEIPNCRFGASCPDPGPDGWAARLESVLETRAPGLPEVTRRRVARAVVEESRAAGLDPLLMAAIIDVESGYDSRARSGVGARGLMQLLPETMAQEAARNGMAAGDPDDPVANVRLGIRYFRRLLDIFGREDRALMAYNAGPNRIGELLQRGRIPELFRVYPARVFAEQRRLRQGFGLVPAPAVAEAGHPVVAW